MKSSDFLTEHTEPLSSDQAHALPAAFVLPDLKNNDAYLQYRFGIALAAARAADAGEVSLDAETVFCENMAVIARSKEEEETLSMALRSFGTHNRSKQISSSTSEESPSVAAVSPVPQNSGKKINRKS